jgi:hypothetical protein
MIICNLGDDIVCQVNLWRFVRFVIFATGL